MSLLDRFRKKETLDLQTKVDRELRLQELNDKPREDIVEVACLSCLFQKDKERNKQYLQLIPSKKTDKLAYFNEIRAFRAKHKGHGKIITRKHHYKNKIIDRRVKIAREKTINEKNTEKLQQDFG